MDTLVKQEVTKHLGEMRLADDITVEERQAIKLILEKSGLIVEVQDRELIIMVKERSD